MDTSCLGGDDAEFQWKVTDGQELIDKMTKGDETLSKSGYKTISIGISYDEGNTFEFGGVLPMIDPPRHDTRKTIDFLHKANVSVKMITGDHKVGVARAKRVRERERARERARERQRRRRELAV